jgi:hypothetical protein
VFPVARTHEYDKETMPNSQLQNELYLSLSPAKITNVVQLGPTMSCFGKRTSVAETSLATPKYLMNNSLRNRGDRI